MRLDSSGLPSASGIRLWLGQHSLNFVVAGFMAYYLGRRRWWTLRQLRWLELPTFLPCIAHFATDQFTTLIRIPILEGWNAVESFYASGHTSSWGAGDHRLWHLDPQHLVPVAL